MSGAPYPTRRSQHSRHLVSQWRRPMPPSVPRSNPSLTTTCSSAVYNTRRRCAGGAPGLAPLPAEWVAGGGGTAAPPDRQLPLRRYLLQTFGLAWKSIVIQRMGDKAKSSHCCSTVGVLLVCCIVSTKRSSSLHHRHTPLFTTRGFLFTTVAGEQTVGPDGPALTKHNLTKAGHSPFSRPRFL